MGIECVQADDKYEIDGTFQGEIAPGLNVAARRQMQQDIKYLKEHEGFRVMIKLINISFFGVYAWIKQSNCFNRKFIGFILSKLYQERLLLILLGRNYRLYNLGFYNMFVKQPVTSAHLFLFDHGGIRSLLTS